MDSRNPLNQCIALIVAGVLFLNPIVSKAAELTVDAAANTNTSIGQAGNGVPVVNIATPNGSGLSNNTFRDYNVSSNGLILNNATGKTQTTQLGGIVVGNPNLKGQAAQVILNQVSGGNRSTLQGYTEVAGQGARVIVANPHGITCNGCGFINTPRATLTTGKPIMDGERLERFQVDGGDITVEGDALNASNLDQFDLITRSAKLNTALHARQLNIVTGRNSVQADSLAATPLADDGSEQPQLAIDSSALGGMYANTIRLVGTERGVGVRLAGDMAATTGDVQVDVNGKVTLAQTTSAGDLRVTAQRAELTGKTYAAGSATVRVRDDVQIDQSLAASQRITVQGARIENRGVIEAGVELDNARNAQGDVALAGQDVRNAGSVVASRRLDIEASATLDNRGGRLIGLDSLQASATRVDNRDSGVVGSERQANLTVHDELDNHSGGKLTADRLDVRTAHLHNTGGQVLGGDVLLAASGAIDNRLGVVTAQRLLDVSAAGLSNGNHGSLRSEGALHARLSALDNSDNGTLSSLGSLSLTTEALDNRSGGSISAIDRLDIRAARVLNQHGLISSVGQVGLVASESLDNQSGRVLGDRGLTLTVQRLLNQNQGLLSGRDGLTLQGSELLNNGGKLDSRTHLELTLDGALDNSDAGRIISEGTLVSKVGALSNRNGGKLSALGSMDVASQGLLDNQSGFLVSNAALTLSAGHLDNSQAGVISAGERAELRSGMLDNSNQGNIGASSLLLIAHQLDNRSQGRISAAGQIEATLNALDQRGHGQLVSETGIDLNLQHGLLQNSDGGLLHSPGTLLLRQLGAVENRDGGEIFSDGPLGLDASTLDNRGGRLISASDLTLRIADVLDNSSKGVMSAGRHLSVQAARLDNTSGGTLASGQSLQASVGGQLDNQEQGTLSAGGVLRVDSGSLLNGERGLLSGNGGLEISTGQLDNRQGGQLISQAGMSVISTALDNRGGLVSSQQALTLTTGNLHNGADAQQRGGWIHSDAGLTLEAATVDSSDGGEISAKGDLLLRVSALIQRQGRLISEQRLDLDVSGGQLVNQGGLISANGPLNIQRLGALDNRAGEIASQQSFSLLAERVDNRQGKVISAGRLYLEAAQLNNSDRGLVSGVQGLVVRGTDLDNSRAGTLSSDTVNSGGRLTSQGALRVEAGSLDNRHGGTLASQRDLMLRLTGPLLNGDGGLLFSQQGQLVVRAAALSNQGGTLKSQGDIVLRLDHDLNNQGGHLESQTGDLDLHAASLDNSSGGMLSAVEGALKGLFSGVFDNAGGIAQAHVVDLKAAAGINNQGGYLSALGGNQRLITSDLNNRNGGLYAAGALQVQGENLFNQSGKIGAGRIDFGLGGTLYNGFGQLESEAELYLRASALDNRAGNLRALGTSGASRFVIAGTLFNDNGVLATASHDLDLQIGGLSNGGGQLLHTGAGTFGLTSSQIMQAGGTLYTNGLLSLEAESWTNSSVLQARRLDLNIGRFVQTAEGKLLAVEHFTGRGHDWTNHGLLASDGSLQLDLTGNYDGNGRLSSLDALHLSANGIRLSNTASLAGGADTWVTAIEQLSNDGRLTALGSLTVNAGDLQNRGTLGSAQALNVTADSLYNHRGLLFSGDDMTLRVDNLRNEYGDLYSLGGLDLAGHANARAVLLENISGSVESAGDMTLAVDTLLNRKDVLTATRKLVGGNVDVYWDDVCKGKGCELYFRATEIWEDVVERDSPSAFITATGALRFEGDAFRNHYSSVSAGGDITVDAGVFENKGAGGGEQRNLNASLYTRDRSQYLAFITAMEQFNQHPGSLTLDQVLAASGYPQSSIYDLIDNTTPTAGAVIASAVVQSAGDVTINATQRIDNSVVRVNQAGAGVINARGDAAADPRLAQTQVRALNPQLPPDLAQRQVNPVTLPSFSLPQGENGLFRISEQRGQVAVTGDALGVTGDRTQSGSGAFVAPLATAANADSAGAQAPSAASAGAAQGAEGIGGLAAGLNLVKGVPDLYVPSTSHKYLVETNPALTDLKQFLSSDYLLDRLDLRADQAVKRLGDGLYEQRLIRQAVVARTGQRYIDGLASDEALFRYLMDNAIASKDALSLSVGVSLSAQQVAALTHDILWMEQVEVNGQNVLAPVLYLAHANGRLAPNGALIQGRDVNLITGGELNNVGTLRATNRLSASAANIRNTGLIEAGGRLDMLATEAIRNAQGGIIAGRDVSLTALTGDVINERSVTRLEGRARGEHVTQDLADSAARIEAANALTITAGQDIGNVGGVLKAGGDLRLDAGRDLYIGSQEGVDSHEYQRRRVSGHDTRITQYASEVTAGGNLTATAGQDLSIVASEVEARRDLALQAGRDVTLAAVANETHSYAKGKKGQTRYERQEDDVAQQAAVVKAGSDLTIDAGRDLRLVASQASAEGEAYLVAGDKLELLAANDSQYSLYDMKKKGNWGSKKTQRDEVTDVQAVGSEVRSGGDLTLASGGDQLYQGAKVMSGADLLIESGGGVTFEAVKDLRQESHEKSKSNVAWFSTKGKGNTDETVRQSELVANGDLVINAVGNVRVDLRQVNQQTVSESIDAMVKADPQLAWLKHVEAQGGVDWRQVKEIHDSFKYDNSGLGPAAQLAIAIVMAAVVGPAAAAWAGGGVGGAAVGAVAASASTNASVSVVNNRGDLGAVAKDVTSSDAIKGYVISGVGAGLTAAYFDGWTGTKTDPITGKVVGPNLGTLKGIGQFAANQSLQSGTSFLLSKALGQDASASDALKTALFNTLAAASFNAVGHYTDQLRIENGTLEKVAIHAMVGGLLSKATGGDFRTGALAGGANEALVSQLSELVSGNERLLTMSSQIVGVLAAASQEDANAGSLNKAAWVAKNGTQYNFLGDHSTQKRDAARDSYRKEGGIDAARELVKLEGSDHRSDNLLEAYQRDPLSLSSDDKAELRAYLQVYAFEGLSNDKTPAQIQESLASLLAGPVSLGDRYPYAGKSEDRTSWADDKRSRMGLFENLTWTRDRGVDEQTYLDARSVLRIGDEQHGLANIGDPAIYFLTGPVGGTVRGTAAVNGAWQVFQGSKQAVEGDWWNAAGNIVVGAMGVAALKIPGGAVEAVGGASAAKKLTDVPGMPATSAIARVGLRDDLAAQAGIPRNIAGSPSNLWGKSIDDIKQSLMLDGASLTPKAPLASSSGRAQIFNVEGHPAIKEVEFHPGGGTHGDSPYYKIVTTERVGNKNVEIRVIDPTPEFSPGTITRYQKYYDTNGNRLKYEGGEWKGWD